VRFEYRKQYLEKLCWAVAIKTGRMQSSNAGSVDRAVVLGSTWPSTFHNPTTFSNVVVRDPNGKCRHYIGTKHPLKCNHSTIFPNHQYRDGCECIAWSFPTFLLAPAQVAIQSSSRSAPKLVTENVTNKNVIAGRVRFTILFFLVVRGCFPIVLIKVDGDFSFAEYVSIISPKCSTVLCTGCLIFIYFTRKPGSLAYVFVIFFLRKQHFWKLRTPKRQRY